MGPPALSPKLQEGESWGFCEIAQPLWSLIQKNLRLQHLPEFLNPNEQKVPNSVLTTLVPGLKINKIPESNSFSDVTVQSSTHGNKDACSYSLGGLKDS